MIRTIAVSLALLAVPLGAHAYSTEVSALITSINERTDCPPNQDILGGGMDPVDVSSMAASVLHPLDPVNLLPASFTVVVRDFGGPHESYRVAAICGSLPEREIVEESFTVPDEGIGVGTVQCPLGKVAVSGGVGLGGPGFATEFSVATLGPYFPQSFLTPDLTSRLAGQHGAPQGWKAAWRSEVAPATGRVAVVCVSKEDVVTIVEHKTVAASSTGAESIFCPEGMTALGGGADATDRSGLRTTSSGPIFDDFPLVATLWERPEGPAPDPIGWRVAFRNFSDSERSIAVAAVCAPEPAGVALAAGACAALALLRRRRA